MYIQNLFVACGYQIIAKMNRPGDIYAMYAEICPGKLH